MSATATETCPECSGRLRSNRSETVCGDCGLVVAADRVDPGPEWRSFPEDDRSRERVGAPLTRSRHDRGLSTEICRKTRLKGRKRRRFRRLCTHHDRAKIASKRERNQVYAFTEITRLTSRLSVPRSTREQACTLFRSAQNEDLVRGRSLEGFAAATVYATCRVNGNARTLAEVIAAAKATEAELKAAYDALNRGLSLPTGPIDPREYLPRFATELGLGPTVESNARDRLTDALDDGLLSGRNPAGVAAAALYAAAGGTESALTQAEAGAVAAVTPVTIRSTYRDLTAATCEASD